MLFNYLSVLSFGEHFDNKEYDFSKDTYDNFENYENIFHSIVYVLYGKKYTFENNTRITLEFSIDHSNYTITRYYYDHDATGNKVTLYLPDDTTVHDEDKVNNIITELFKKDAEDFEKVFLVREEPIKTLLTLTSSKREAYIQQLPIPESYIAGVLDTKESIAKSKIRELKNREAALLKDISYDDLTQKIKEDHDSLLIKEENIAKKQQEYNRKIKELQEAHHANETLYKYEKTKKEYTSLLEQKPYYDALKDKINAFVHVKEVNELYERSNDLSLELKSMLKEKQILEEEIKQYHAGEKDNEDILSVIEEKRDQRNSIRKQKKELEQRKENLMQYFHDMATKEQLIKDHMIISNNIDVLTGKINRISKNNTRDHHTLSSFEIKKQEYDHIKAIYHNLCKRKEDLQELVKEYDVLEESKNRLFDLLENWNNGEEEYQLLEKEYKSIEHKYILQQAGMLAKDLKDGMACPVCGAVHHLKLVTVNEYIDLDTYSRIYHKYHSAFEKRHNDFFMIQDQKEKIRLLQEDLDQHKEELEIHEELSKELFNQLLSPMLHEEIKLEKKYKHLKEEIYYLTVLKESVAKSDIDLKELKEELDANIKQKNALDQRIDAITEMYRHQGYTSVREFNDTLEKYNENIIHIEEEIAELYHKHDTYIRIMNSKEIVYDNLLEKEIDLKKDVSDLKDQYLICVQEYFYDEEEFMELLEQLGNESSYRREITNYEAYLERKKHVLNSYGSMEHVYLDEVKLEEDADGINDELMVLKNEYEKEYNLARQREITLENIGYIRSSMNDEQDKLNMYLKQRNHYTYVLYCYILEQASRVLTILNNRYTLDGNEQYDLNIYFDKAKVDQYDNCVELALMIAVNKILNELYGNNQDIVLFDHHYEDYKERDVFKNYQQVIFALS